MSAKLCKQQSHDEFRLPNLSKEILEVKKRIQLSEGQRKALFEEIANESKRDADDILRLKKELAKVQLAIYEQRNNVLGGLLPVVRPLPATVSSAPCKRVTQMSGAPRVHTASASTHRKHPEDDDSVKKLLASVIGNAAHQKSLKDIEHYLDLQQIDKNKSLDLLNYKCKQKQAKLKQLAVHYQELLLKKDAGVDADEVKAKNDILAKEYRNRINAVQVQIKEAEHVRVRYRAIRWKMQEDAAKFESKTGDIELELKQQQCDIDKVKLVNKEALKLRSEARGALVKEERQVLAANATREKQSLEGQRLVEARQCDLAHLEKHFYQRKHSRGVVLVDQQELSPEDDVLLQEDEHMPVDPVQQLKADIDVLNDATGSSSIEEVLAKVKGQMTTQVRLMTLRKTKEGIKAGKQRRFDAMLHELEELKFADDRANQQSVDDVEAAKAKIAAEMSHKRELEAKMLYVNGIVDKIVDKLLNTYLCMYQEEHAAHTSAVEVIRKINVAIRQLQLEQLDADGSGGVRAATVEQLLEEINEREGNWLPEPYNDIIRRTPLPNSSAPTPVPTQSATVGSEDEEELPTRNYLKRQAQLVVDAKNKRKTMRFPIPKTK